MALREALTLLCSLAVVCSSGNHESCELKPGLFDSLTGDLKVAAECSDDSSLQWSSEQAAEVLIHMRNLTERLQKRQLKECQEAEPKMCQQPEAPSNGGLACVTASNKRYCKPICDSGYDFSFLRRSRLFEECGEQTNYRWSSLYVGGNRLAVCNKAALQISSRPSAYFTKDCLTTKSSSEQWNTTMEVLLKELKDEGVTGNPTYHCLLCGRP
ncbi:uncharacterized protein si:ch1073-126c3.2 [Cyprinodon tularosa]|uniref:uncharacterized protein si:ch1073-126c3.2 n=1 Tax=Cyprinodon tularosa TaxID=77115 RepID=UPI0018E2656C|nr:uncharacterized protein si:ch1073-126c3.2 [Cyprinodon tularosa]